MNKNIHLPIDDDEQDLMSSLANGEWKEVSDIEKYRKEAIRYADSTIKKDKRMNIRVSERDLKNLKIKAMEEGLPYQTMVSMILHKYVTGRLIEKS